MIRFGIVGCGGISKWHINAVLNISETTLTAVCDDDPARAETAGREYGVEYFSDVDKFFESGLVDAVCVCTPSGLHAGLCVRALNLGLHVVAEKPLAITRPSLSDVLAAEKSSAGKLMTISQIRYGRDVRRARELIGSGRLGRVLMADLSMKYYREPSYFSNNPWRGTLAMDGGGALINQGIHGLDMMCWLCSDVKRVNCLSGTFAHSI